MTDATEPTRPAAQPAGRRRKSRWKGRLLALAITGALSLCAVEFGLRFVLFSDSPELVERTRTLRDPRKFGHAFHDSLFWGLRHKWGLAAQDRANLPDPILGWRGRFSGRLDSYVHNRVFELEGRQPILLYGDSFAACATPVEDCFDGLYVDLPRAEDSMLLNYGVGGFGVDQIYLCVRESMRAWDASGLPKPQVVVSFFVDNDMDRADLAIRDWTKPHFLVEDGQLVEVPPPTPSGAEWFEHHRPATFSWAWRWLVHGSGRIPPKWREKLDGSQDHRRRLEELIPLLFAAIHEELAARDIDHCFLILPGDAALRQPTYNWREPLAEQALTDLGVRWVSARPEFMGHMRATGMKVNQYFGTEGKGVGHYTAQGNKIAMAALLRAIDGESDAGKRPSGFEPLD